MQSDKDIAENYALEVGRKLEAVLTVMSAARKEGFMINFSLGPGPSGDTSVLSMSVDKVTKLVG